MEINYNDVQKAWEATAEALASPYSEIDLDSDPEQIAAVFKEHAFEDKDDYLQWRDEFRIHVAVGSDLQRTWKAKRTGQEDDYVYEMRLHRNARIITDLIKARRLSKIAAGVQMKRNLQAAA